jgi:dienelactone hydrolase
MLTSHYSKILFKRVFISLTLALAGITYSFAAQDIPKLSDFEPEAYKKQEVFQNIRVMTEGNGSDRAYAFYPADQSPEKLPLVIFLHGWMGTNPKNFGALIDHLVRRGSVVVYPVYQIDGNTPPQIITDIAAKSISGILKRLDKENPNLIDSQKVMYYGFSMGASMSINFAANPNKYNLPIPKGMILAAPGDAKHVAQGELATSIVTTPIHQVPLNIPIVLMTGQEDKSIGVPTATSYWNEICAQNRQKIFISWPPGKADHESIASGHGAPGAPDDRYDFPNINEPTPTDNLTRLENFPESKSINNLDFYGQWKIVTGFLDAIKNGGVPSWIFTEQQVITNLGKFKNGEQYPPAVIEKSCPAPMPILVSNTKTKPATKLKKPKN